jgi:uncharacterized membrane protein YobD (UPF0266 family)
MKKIAGILILIFVLLVPARMIYTEIGQHSNVTHILMFLLTLAGVYIGFALIDSKQTNKSR